MAEKKDSLLETIAVYDKLGAKYADQIAHVRLPQLQEFIDMLPYNARVLDVGCAAGRDSAILRDAEFEVIGIDLSESFLELARKRVFGVEFQHMDARNLNFGHDAFDGIWANAVLLNLDRSEIPKVLQGFWEIMKPGGICFVGVKEGKGEKFIGEALVDNMKRRETYFAKYETEEFLRAAGFEIKRSYIYGDELGRSTTKWVCVFARK
jgi:SAM-dependent methyltransferase